MKHRITSLILAVSGIAAILILDSGINFRSPNQSVRAEEDEAPAVKQRDDSAQSETEARGRARLLHETIHGALQVMHRDFFREDEGLKIPSRSLDDVFAELDRTHGVKVRWLAVNAEPMNVDHQPKDDFERDAVKALASGKQEFDAIEGDAFRFAGLIRLPSQCLKCHVPRRTSNNERAAGVVITMPLGKKQ
ncbi:MAG: DUF3365 domain-containing protein [Rhodopirellula sp.]|nr:DUF3365 domain-containing protein [Rhodopirellula sp.]